MIEKGQTKTSLELSYSTQHNVVYEALAVVLHAAGDVLSGMPRN
jgi:hypothetical protein